MFVETNLTDFLAKEKSSDDDSALTRPICVKIAARER
jgi:hypothetical protein